MLKLDILYNRLRKYKLRNINKLIIKKENVKCINIINTHFIEKNILIYIKKNLKKKLIIKYNYKNITIFINIYYKYINNKIELIENIIKRIIFMMDITNIYKNINIDIYYTDLKKTLPCVNCEKILTSENVNSALSYENNIIIFRKEELLKVLIHELIHVLDIDIKYENIELKKKLLDDMCLNSLLVNESYVETWAIIIYSYLEANKKCGKFSDFLKIIKKNTEFNIEQCKKIIVYLKYSIKKRNNICIKKLNDKTNIISYFILKTYNLINIEKFLELFMDKKRVIINKYNYKKYINYLKKIIDVLKNINIKYNIKETLNLRMSI